MAKAGKKRFPETGTTTIPIPESWDIPTAIEQQNFQKEFGRKIDRAIAIRDGLIAPPWIEQRGGGGQQIGRVREMLRVIYPPKGLVPAHTSIKTVHANIRAEFEKRGWKPIASSDTVARALGRRR
jgi:hypothetical protein